MNSYYCFLGAPKITYDSALQDKIVRKGGTSVEINAEITGHPKPTSKWFFGDKELFSSGDVLIKKDDKGCTLKVSHSTGTNTGKYRLLAENAVGTDEAVFDVLVKDKPSPPRNLRIKEVDKNHVIITWEEPEQDGGSPITEYVIQKKDATKTNFINAGTTDGSTHTHKVNSLYVTHNE